MRTGVCVRVFLGSTGAVVTRVVCLSRRLHNSHCVLVAAVVADTSRLLRGVASRPVDNAPLPRLFVYRERTPQSCIARSVPTFLCDLCAWLVFCRDCCCRLVAACTEDVASGR